MTFRSNNGSLNWIIRSTQTHTKKPLVLRESKIENAYFSQKAIKFVELCFSKIN